LHHRLAPLLPHLDGLGCIDGNLVVGGIPVGQSQVEVLDLQIQVWQDELQGKGVTFSSRCRACTEPAAQQHR
jgi:hypothetical protein